VWGFAGKLAYFEWDDVINVVESARWFLKINLKVIKIDSRSLGSNLSENLIRFF
jgi:hypothetical protein